MAGSLLFIYISISKSGFNVSFHNILNWYCKVINPFCSRTSYIAVALVCVLKNNGSWATNVKVTSQPRQDGIFLPRDVTGHGARFIRSYASDDIIVTTVLWVQLSMNIYGGILPVTTLRVLRYVASNFQVTLDRRYNGIILWYLSLSWDKCRVVILMIEQHRLQDRK